MVYNPLIPTLPIFMDVNKGNVSNFGCLFVCQAVSKTFHRNQLNYLLFIYLADHWDWCVGRGKVYLCVK